MTIACRFKSKLPDQCALLRSKVFPNTSFSDDDDGDDGQSHRSSRSASPANDAQRRHKELNNKRNKPALSRAASSASVARENFGGSPSRSRSLSVSLAQEADARRSASLGPKRVLNREVSMSRKAKKPTKEKSKESLTFPKATQRNDPAPEPRPQKSTTASDKGVTLVADSPVKKIKGVSEAFRSGGAGRVIKADYEHGEDIWDIPSSPEILLLGSAEDDPFG